MTTALYPGTFDPPTRGHVDIALYALRHEISPGGQLVIVFGSNPDKTGELFTKENRRRLFRAALPPEALPRIAFEFGSAENEDALVAHYKPNKIIRGIRGDHDLAPEMALAERLNGKARRDFTDFRVVWLHADKTISGISATIARDAIMGQNELDLADLGHLLPDATAKLLQDLLMANPDARRDKDLLNQLVNERLAYG